MRGKRVPPPIIFAGLAEDPSAAVDEAYFRRHPHAREYSRPPIPGEQPAVPPCATVVVRRIGAQRIRLFCVPEEGCRDN